MSFKIIKFSKNPITSRYNFPQKKKPISGDSSRMQNYRTTRLKINLPLARTFKLTQNMKYLPV